MYSKISMDTSYSPRAAGVRLRVNHTGIYIYIDYVNNMVECILLGCIVSKNNVETNVVFNQRLTEI